MNQARFDDAEGVEKTPSFLLSKPLEKHNFG